MSVASVIKDYQARKQAKKEAKAKKIVITDEEKQEPTKTIFEKPIKMNRMVNKTNLAFGVSEARVVEILRKMIAVAQLYPKYSTIMEVTVNCSDRFTEMERLYSIFLAGRIQGQASILRKKKIHIKFDAATMPLEAKLLSLLSRQVLIEDKLLNRLMASGKDDR